jgi:hypothetical protein
MNKKRKKEGRKKIRKEKTKKRKIKILLHSFSLSFKS